MLRIVLDEVDALDLGVRFRGNPGDPHDACSVTTPGGRAQLPPPGDIRKDIILQVMFPSVVTLTMT